jgi:uracil-DNA glycosylase
MAHQFDPGYNRYPFKTLVGNYPGADIYPFEDFRTEWGPIFHRGRLDWSAKVLVVGQDPGQHESIARRILVGEAGQRTQGFLHKLGIETSYVMINTFLYSVYGYGGEHHRADPLIADYRNRWLDALLVGRSVQAVIALGVFAGEAFAQWQATPAGQSTPVAFRQITHPTYPESQSTLPRAEATKNLLLNWNDALAALRPAITGSDVPMPTETYGEAFDEEKDLAPIPEIDLPAGLPDWMRSLDSWAVRQAVHSGDPTEEKRATVVVRVPTVDHTWLQPAPPP